MLGAGSQEILKNAMRAFMTPSKGLVTALPTFENCPGFAKKSDIPLLEVKVDSADAAGRRRHDRRGPRRAGLVFFNNPNNPTATVHGAKTVTDLVTRIRKASPDTVILIDEAYHDYVTDPSYQRAVPLALSTPNVFVTRTFSKAYGMAGMRIGYAIGMVETMKPLAQLKMPYNVSVFGIAAAIAALERPEAHRRRTQAQHQGARVHGARRCRTWAAKPADSQGNFLFADIGRPAKDFRDACAKQGVDGRPRLPAVREDPLRISIGTMEEMQKAVDVFRTVLKAPIIDHGRREGGRRPC